MQYSTLHARLADFQLQALAPCLEDAFLDSLRHGDFPRWRRLAAGLPALTPGQIDLGAIVRAGAAADGDAGSLATLESALRELIPWRKGPFELFGIGIDSEWRSDLKWDRLAGTLGSLEGKQILDVGCGNGYHCYRMVEAGADLALGLEPHLPYVGQFLAIDRYLETQPVHVLPLSLEQMPDTGPVFDLVFSMGVLYHARSPFDHLLQLRRCLRQGGQVVLESIVVPGQAGYALTPEDRYARMRNVWFLPSVDTMTLWLRRCGFTDIHLIDRTRTDASEQRQTDWMPFDSLAQSLQPGDPERTLEGYPAPYRAILMATLK